MKGRNKPFEVQLEGKIEYQFSTEMWRDKGESGWYFMTVPKNFSEEILQHLQWQEEGWGRMKATAMIGELTWKTSIWFDSKGGNYILPVKAEIRKKGALSEGDVLEVRIFV